MVNLGKCPKCEKTATKITVEKVDVMVGLNDAYKGVTYHCSFCKAILGAGIDQIALAEDTANRVARKLGRVS